MGVGIEGAGQLSGRRECLVRAVGRRLVGAQQQRMDQFIDDIEVVKLGREIRFHDVFDPAGTNVNFVCLQNDDIVAIRTYERGVEDETLACGTGAIASAIVISYKKKIKSPVKVMTRSGEYLYIYYKVKQGRFYDIFLEGDARIIYKAQLWEDAWKRSDGK